MSPDRMGFCRDGPYRGVIVHLDHDIGAVDVAHPNGRLHPLQRYRITHDCIEHPSSPNPLLVLVWSPAQIANRE